jgi:hypothetical protein
MPFLFIIIGVVFVVASARNTNQQLVSLMKNDFTGKNNFIYWSLSILLIGLVGYVKELQPISRMFMALVVIVLFLANGGVFTKFFATINAWQYNSLLPTSASVGTGTGTGSGTGAAIGTTTGNTTAAPFSIPLIHGLG